MVDPTIEDGVSSRPGPEPKEADAVDMARLSEMADDDPAGMNELAGMYLVQADELLEKLGGALRRGAGEDAEKIAHKLGGSSATCGMAGIVSPLRELEHSGKAGRWPESEPLLLEAERQLARIRARLTALPGFPVPPDG